MTMGNLNQGRVFSVLWPEDFTSSPAANLPCLPGSSP